MGYVVQGEAVAVRQLAKRPYRVVYFDLNQQRRRVQQFATLGKAEGFRSRLRIGSQPQIRLVTRKVGSGR